MTSIATTTPFALNPMKNRPRDEAALIRRRTDDLFRWAGPKRTVREEDRSFEEAWDRVINYEGPDRSLGAVYHLSDRHR